MLDLLNNGEGVEDGHGNLGGQIAFNVGLQLWVPIWQDIMIEGQGIMECTADENYCSLTTYEESTPTIYFYA